MYQQTDLRHSLGVNGLIEEWDSEAETKNIKKNQALKNTIKTFRAHLAELQRNVDAQLHPFKLPTIAKMELA